MQASRLMSSSAGGKVYEAYILGLVAKNLTQKEGCSLLLSYGSKIVLKSSPGPINLSYPSIRVTRGARLIGELWTDVEFVSLSHFMRSPTSTPSAGEYHELDLVMTVPGMRDRPTHNSILLGVECKDTVYEKDLLREILGIRRELSLLHDGSDPSCRTAFKKWPRSSVPAIPASCILVYSTSPAINKYSAPGKVFGIDFNYEPT